MNCRWRLHTWQHILFSDESRFLLRLSDGRYRVYRRRGERFTDQCVYETDRFGGGKVMVWAGIYHDGSAQPKIVQGTFNAVNYRRYSWYYRSVLSATAKLWSRLSTWQCKMLRGSCLSRLSEPESHPCSSLTGIITGSVTNCTFMGWTR